MAKGSLTLPHPPPSGTGGLRAAGGGGEDRWASGFFWGPGCGGGRSTVGFSAAQVEICHRNVSAE